MCWEGGCLTKGLVCLTAGPGVCSTSLKPMGSCWTAAQHQTVSEATGLYFFFFLFSSQPELNPLPSGDCAGCTIWPTPSVSESNLYTEKRRWSPARAYVHCSFTLENETILVLAFQLGVKDVEFKFYPWMLLESDGYFKAWVFVLKTTFS